MSIWDWATGKAELDLAGNAFHKITGQPTADEKRNQQYAINDQVREYKKQSELAQQQIDAVREEKNVVKRQINEKQIRALRNNYGTNTGFLRSNEPNTLGNGSNLTNKLGT